MHRPTRRRFPRRRTYSKGIDDMFQIDLADTSNLSAYNDGYRYLLNCIDVFTKRAWSVPLKTETGCEVSDAFERHVLSQRQCNMVQSEKGTEFLNSTCQSMLPRHGIKFYTSENVDIKAAVVERFNGTLKGKNVSLFHSETHETLRRRSTRVFAFLQSHISQIHRHGTCRSYSQKSKTRCALDSIPWCRKLFDGSLTLATKCASRCDGYRYRKTTSVIGRKRRFSCARKCPRCR